MAVAANALTTLARVKAELGITDALKDALLEGWINDASEAIERRCGRKFQRAEVLEKLRGTGTQSLLLSRTPVVSVTSVEVDGTMLEDDDYEIDDGGAGILNRESGWPTSGESCVGIAWTPVPGTGKRNIEVTYTAGYVTPGQATEMDVSQEPASSPAQTLFPTLPPGLVGTMAVATIRDVEAGTVLVTFDTSDGDSGAVGGLFALPTTINLGQYSTALLGCFLVVEFAAIEADSNVVYTFAQAVGARDLPADLERAAIETVKALNAAQLRDPAVTSEQLGDYSVTYAGVNTGIGRGAGGIIPDNVLPLVDAYRSGVLIDSTVSVVVVPEV